MKYCYMKKKNIIIVYELFKRECVNVAILKAELERRNYNVVVKNKYEDIFLGHCDLLIVPNAYNTEDFTFYKYRFSCNNEKILNLQVEQVVEKYMEDKKIWVADGNAKKCFFSCWGPNRKKSLLDKGVELSHIRVTGAIQLDQLKPKFDFLYKSKLDISKEYNIDCSKTWIMYVSSLSFASKNSAAYKSALNEFESKRIKNIQNFHIRTQNVIIDSIEYILDNSNQIFIYRPHTTEEISSKLINLKQKYPNKFYIIKDYNIKQWFKICDIIIMGLSTSAIECYALNKEFIIYVPIEPIEDVSSYFFDGIDIISSYEEFKKLVDSGFNRTTKIPESNISRYYSFDNEYSYLSISDYADEIVRLSSKSKKIFRVKQLIYLLFNFIPIKLFIKKMYQYLYVKFGIRINNELLRNKLFITKWEESIDDKKRFNDIFNKVKEYIK